MEGQIATRLGTIRGTLGAETVFIVCTPLDEEVIA